MAEEDDVEISYPTIDPTFFDLIVIGTGLPESLIAAASSSASKSVLHLDSNSFYGAHFSSLPLDDFTSFLLHHHQQQQQNCPSSTSSSVDYVAVDLKPKCLYSDIEVSSYSSGEEDLKKHSSRKFSLDLSGPRVLFCADSAVKVLLDSGASHHVEFKSVDASFVFGSNGELYAVPDSRSAIFKDRTLGLTEKNQLMRFFKLVQEHFEGGSTTTTEGNDTGNRRKISDEDLESPFVEFLTKQRLPPKIKSIILYAIAMADYDQEKPELCNNLLKTKEGIESLALFHSSVGRFPNAPGAMIYPIYGQGELPQAFCRCAAVKGALYVLRMPVTALLLNKESGQYKGVRLASGQEIFSHQLVMSPSNIVQSQPFSSPASDLLEESFESGNQAELKMKVARGICITRCSIKPDILNLLVIFPPRSLYSEQLSSVRALQLGSGVAACPSGLFVLYLSTLCDDEIQGKESLRAAMNALLAPPLSENPIDSTSIQSESASEAKPNLLWSAMYIQELEKGLSRGAIISCPMPDGNLDYRNILESSVKLFHEIYQEEFFPETKAPDQTEDDESLLD